MRRVAVLLVAVASASASANVARPPPEPNGRGIPIDMVEEPPMQRPVPPPPPSPVADVTAHAQGLVGTWTCTGSDSPLVIALDLDNAWVVLSTATRVAYRSYDPVAVQWTQLVMASGGASATETSPGEDKGAWTFTGAAIREREVRTADGLVLRREELRDEAWTTSYEGSCVTSSRGADTPRR